MNKFLYIISSCVISITIGVIFIRLDFPIVGLILALSGMYYSVWTICRYE